LDAAGLNSCPFCGENIKSMRSGFGEIICSACGGRLWFIADISTTWLFKSSAELEQIISFLRENGKLEKLGPDSLDLVELVLEMEERQPGG